MVKKKTDEQVPVVTKTHESLVHLPVIAYACYMHITLQSSVHTGTLVHFFIISHDAHNQQVLEV